MLAGSPAFAHECECDGRGTLASWMGDWDLSFYAAASLDQSTFDDWSMVAAIDAQTYTARAMDDQDIAFRVRGGMEFAEYFALEVGYADFGQARFSGTSDGSGSLWVAGTQRETIEVDGYSLHLVGRLPVKAAFAAAARVGASVLMSERHQSGTFDDAGTPTPFNIRDSGTSTELSYGVALEYDGFAPIRLAAG
ncbi:MAG: outer membrane beta-barrel protein, partial [Nevskiaceae bacterium]